VSLPRSPRAGPQALDALLGAYRPPADRYDELRDRHGRVRPAWEEFTRHTSELTPDALKTTQAHVTQQIHESSITHAVYAAADGRPRPWTLDALPFLVSGQEWTALAAGVTQLARLLNLVAADLYGPRTLLREGTIPPAVVLRHPGFLRACDGVSPPSGIYLHQAAFDLARDPDGRWQVVNVRTQTPAGAGYALENRATIVRMFPEAFRELHVQAIAPYFARLRDTLMRTAPCDDGAPHVVLLTPGPYSGRYFEHAYLARYFGFPLVEGADLTVRHDRVFLKTIDGLRQVHGIVRHLADDYCDPLELRADSTLGVPGLVQAWRAGRVLVANAFGAGVLESPALRGLLPALSARLLGEPLAASLLPSWWCGDSADVDALVRRGRPCVIRGAYAGPASEGVDWPDASALRARLQTEDAGALVAEAPIVSSHAPVWNEDHLESRPVLLRVFAAADANGEYTVMAGGLTRNAASRQRAVTSGQGGSKDTWILSASAVEPRVVELLTPPHVPADGPRAGGPVSSRAAEHLFWLGRYAERAETSARLLRTTLAGLGDPSTPDVPRQAFLRIALVNGVLDRGDPDIDEIDTLSASSLIRRLIDNFLDAQEHRSLAFNVRQTVRVAGAIRDRLSSDNWRLLNQLFALAAIRPARVPDLHDALALLERAIVSLVAVAGLEMAHMSRDHGWRFLSLGRHLERLASIATTFAALGPEDALQPSVLELLLRASDSLGMFRTRFVRRPDWPAVAELVVFDAQNPRSLAFQLGKIARHVPQLPDAGSLDILSDLARLEEALAASRLDFPQRPEWIGGLLADCEHVTGRLSDALTSRYFSHAYELPHVTAGR